MGTLPTGTLAALKAIGAQLACPNHTEKIEKLLFFVV
jgi:hypothetical protein